MAITAGDDTLRDVLAELRTFCTAADLGSLGRAAIKLHVSQPALSKRLHTLEALAGTELLERSARGVTLTPAGRRLYAEAQRLLAEADVVEELLASLRHETSPIRVAASHTAAESFLPGTLASVELVVANSGVVRTLVSEGRADLGIAAASHGHLDPRLREEPLVDDEVVCAVPPHHPWARVGRVTLQEFLRTPMVVRDRTADARETVDLVLRERGLQAAPPLIEAGTTAAAKAEARARNAPVLLSANTLSRHFVRIDPGGLRFPRAFALVLPARGAPPRAVSAFAEAVRSTCAPATSEPAAGPTA